MKKLHNTEAEQKKSVAFKINVYIIYLKGAEVLFLVIAKSSQFYYIVLFAKNCM